MIHRATVERNTATTTDDYGHPVKPVWGAHLTISCRVYHDKKRLAIDGDKIATIQTPRIAFPLSVDVTKNDRVTAVKDRNGTTLWGDTYEINEVVRLVDHYEAELRAVE